jgi:DNA-binding response OmpR family regulator
MMVDDGLDILLLTPVLLATWCDADIEYYRSPRDALSAFLSATGSYELVITDLEMPGMSGIELGRRLRALKPKTKILLTSSSEILTEAEARGMGFCGLLHKPFSTARLAGCLRSAGVGNISTDISVGTSVLTPAQGALGQVASK